ncbi:MAG TPA: peptidoglycan-binding domain-containing protein [Candidatus Paceibacterota bacterium]|nr:peptidoglycan-binding domain-containing protein [Candidatus Paceibacterota bacterium]
MNPRVLSAAAGVAFAVSLVAGAPLAQAAALTPVQIDSITNLLQAFGADATTIANVQAALEGMPVSTVTSSSTASTTVPTDTTNQPVSANACAALSQNLSVGSTDGSSEGEVSRLQAFLSKDKSIYPEGLVTGYYGDATRAAVAKWQESHGISTVGIVGPQTRGEIAKEMEMESECSGSSSDATASSTESQSSSEATASSTASDSSSTSTSTPHSDN